MSYLHNYFRQLTTRKLFHFMFENRNVTHLNYIYIPSVVLVKIIESRFWKVMRIVLFLKY